MKKILKKIGNIFQALIILLVVYVFTTSIISFAKKDIPTVFQRNFFVVQTDSMEDSIMVGDLIVSKKTTIDKVKEGDIITFVCIDPNEIVVNQVITHRCIEIINEEGKIYLVTKGDNAISKDRLKVSEENFLGVVTFSSHFLGKCITLMNKGGIFVVLALMLIIATMVFIKQNIEYHHSKKEEIEEKRKEKLKQELLEEIKQELNSKKE